MKVGLGWGPWRFSGAPDHLSHREEHRWLSLQLAYRSPRICWGPTVSGAACGNDLGRQWLSLDIPSKLCFTSVSSDWIGWRPLPMPAPFPFVLTAFIFPGRNRSAPASAPAFQSPSGTAKDLSHATAEVSHWWDFFLRISKELSLILISSLGVKAK